ncbi:DUF3306 domain-containing protein [Paracidovorax wautersii]|uniref:DUF3306 domain-containing protein n=1 Tax=Paracidovorax wautersii TaxID=1177982 RepID=UPI0031E24E90
MAEADGFFSRWSRRKQQTRESGQPLPEAAGSEPAARVAPAAAVAPSASAPASASPAEPVAQQPAAPTLDDVQALHAQSDFGPFVARSVAPQVRNAAMRKLFADPHFNVMDGLDVYIEDYSLPDPLPASMLQQMVSARSLGLVTDPEPPAAGPEGGAVPPPKSDCDAGAAGAAGAPHGADVAQSDLCNAIPSQPAPDAAAPPSGDVAELARASQSTDAQDADMRLQPDHAARLPGAGRGAT